MDSCNCKLGRVVDENKIDLPQYNSVNNALINRWRGEDGYTAQGYRSLAEWFNKRLLYTAYERAGRETLGGRIDSDYEMLIGDNTLAKEELRDSLISDGVSVDSVVDDMISYGTIRKHIVDCLGEEKKQQSSDTDWERNSIDLAKSLTKKKCEKALSSLDSKGVVRGAKDSTVEVDILLGCDECQTVVPFAVALQQGYVCEKHSAETLETEVSR